MTMNTESSLFLTVREVAATLRISARTVDRRIKEQKLKAHKLGKRWVIRPEDLQCFLENLPSNC